MNSNPSDAALADSVSTAAAERGPSPCRTVAPSTGELRGVDWVYEAPAPALPFDVLVLDASLRQSLVTVRSLGRRRRSVAALETFGNVPAFSSRWCQRGFSCPALPATDAYLLYLEQL